MLKRFSLAATATVVFVLATVCPAIAADGLIKVNNGKETHTPEAFTQLFQSFRTNAATLSPDGKYVAYSVRQDDTLSVVIAETANLGKLIARVDVVSDAMATPTITDLKEKTPGEIRWMRWVTPTRLVLETNQDFPFNRADGEWFNVSGAIVAMDADGKNAQLLLTPKDVKEESADTTLAASAVSPLWSPDEPLPTAPKAEEDPVTLMNGQAPTTASVQMTGTVSTARGPQIFDLCADDSESVLVRAPGSRGYDVYKLNVVTGKYKLLFQEVYDQDLMPLIDRQGHARVAIRSTLRTPFPHRFVYDRNGGFGRWTDLDKISPTANTAAFTVSPENFFGERSIPLGFEDDPSVVYFASNVGRNTYGIYALNTKTGKRLDQAVEHPWVDLISPDVSGYARSGSLVFDRYHRKLIGVRYNETAETVLWLQPDLETLQHKLEGSFPGDIVELLEWDNPLKHVLIKVRGISDAGAYYLYEVSSGKLLEFVRRAPWIDPEANPKTVAFSFDDPKGGRVTGVITFPTVTRMRPIPLAVMCPVDPWMRVSAEYRAETVALTEMGVAVAQINPRGVWGFGTKFRDAAKGGYEQVQIADIIASIDYLSKKLPVHPKRVALIGEGRGAYLALRALQSAPDRFRCVVAIEPTVDLDSWIADAQWTTRDASRSLMKAYLGSGDKSKERDLVEHAEQLTKPVLFLSYPGPLGGHRTQTYLDAKRLQLRMQKEKVPTEFIELSDDYRVGLPKARGEAYGKVEGFINEYVYAYDVKLGDTKEVK